MSQRFMLFIGIAVVAFICAAPALAQQPQPAQRPQTPPPGEQQQPRPPGDPLADSIFPPDMIMQHQRELALTEDQKIFMRGEIQRTTTRFNELQWQLQDQMEALHETVKGNSINEQLALSQLDKVLESEREIKRLHMEMAIRIKNKLTPDQQTKLQSFRQNKPPRDGGPGMGPGRGPGVKPGGPGPGRPGGPGLGQPGGQGPGGPGQGPRPAGPGRPGGRF
ncbi:MAG: Spy/CpxP family protein refolding chaperone [Pyrinomonadaceae bacterium]